MPLPADSFIAARDFLLAHRTDYTTAYRDFRWPELDRFNWALDYFDRIAAGNEHIALWLVHEGSHEEKISFAALAERSNRVANHLRSLGIRRGDRILLMLGNVLPLWEVMLAAMKLGAVIVPATTLLTESDLADRFARGRVRHVIVGAEHTGKFQYLSGDYTRIAVGAAEGWHDYDDAYTASASFARDGETPASDPMLLYFTSGTTAKPKLVLHSHQSYPVGHLSTLYWLGIQPGDIHLNISSPGWAKHAWSCFSRPGTPKRRSWW
ncbi:MAG: AMP-binding protein [Aliidongia sp.]